MKLSKVERDSVVIVTPHAKKIDASVAVGFKTQLMEIVEGGRNRLILNLKEVDFIDSSGLGALVSVLKRMGSEGGIKLYSVKDSVRSILELTQLDKVFGIHMSEKGAIEGFNH